LREKRFVFNGAELSEDAWQELKAVQQRRTPKRTRVAKTKVAPAINHRSG
jgi:hypothetical protein